MVYSIGGKTDRELQFEAEKAEAEDCPSGRVEVTGTILKVEDRETQFGTSWKMAVKDDRGFVVWMTAPSVLFNSPDPLKGRRVSVTVALTPSDKDKKFGFGSRPSKARFV